MRVSGEQEGAIKSLEGGGGGGGGGRGGGGGGGEVDVVDVQEIRGIIIRLA